MTIYRTLEEAVSDVNDLLRLAEMQKAENKRLREDQQRLEFLVDEIRCNPRVDRLVRNNNWREAIDAAMEEEVNE